MKPQDVIPDPNIEPELQAANVAGHTTGGGADKAPVTPIIDGNNPALGLDLGKPQIGALQPPAPAQAKVDEYELHGKGFKITAYLATPQGHVQKFPYPWTGYGERIFPDFKFNYSVKRSFF